MPTTPSLTMPGALLLSISFLAPAAGGQFPVRDLDRSGEGYPVYRIPALAVSTRGTLIAAYDGRPSGADLPSNIALLVRRSFDHGGSWQARQVVRADTAPFGFGDPSLLVDRSTGRIFLFHAAGTLAGFFGSDAGRRDDDPAILHVDLSWSDDDGTHWQHRRLTNQVKDSSWTGIFASSGAGIQLRHGRYAGRLVQQFVIRLGSRNYAASLYSDDHGEHWQMGTLVGPGLDENKVVELSDGTLLLNSRARPHRLVARSLDGGEHWSVPLPDAILIDPANNGALLRVDEAAVPPAPRSRWLLFSNTADTASRRNLTLRLSCDDGVTWRESRTLVAGAAAYSTLAMLSDGTVGVLFERGDYEAISFIRLPLESIGRCAER